MRRQLSFDELLALCASEADTHWVRIRLWRIEHALKPKSVHQIEEKIQARRAGLRLPPALPVIVPDLDFIRAAQARYDASVALSGEFVPEMDFPARGETVDAAGLNPATP